MSVPSNPFLLIDADILLYRCGFAAEKTKYLVETSQGHYLDAENHKEAKGIVEASGGVIWSRKEVEPVENAITNLQTVISSITSELWPGQSRFAGDFFLTGKGNFRETLRGTKKEYKDNRDPAHRPKHYRALKEYLVEKCGAVICTGQEADDAIGQAAYSSGVDSYVVVSNDKDLDQIAGWHYDWTKKESYYVNEEEAIKFFYVQLLAGDPTDNIGGVLSRAKAEARIRDCKTPTECAKAAVEAYQEKYGGLGYWKPIDTTALLVWIRRGLEGAPGFTPPLWEHLNGEG